MAVKKLDTNTAIIEAAIDLFATHGFEPTTFAQIAKKCKISQPAIYNHFSSKMSILNACAIYSAQLGREYIDKNAKPELKAKDRLHSYIVANLQWFGGQKKYALALTSLFYFAGSNEQTRDILEQVQSATLERIKLILIQGLHESAWKNINVDDTAWVIHSLLVGEIYKVIYFKGSINESRSEEIIWKTIQKILK